MSPLEQHLEQIYTAMFGADAAQGLLKAAKCKIESEPSFTTPPIPREELRDEGVTRNDWDWWWGMQPLDRAMMIAVDEHMMMSALLKFRAEGLSRERAAAKVRRTIPLFGNPRRKGSYGPDDRPLPRELKNRVTSSAMELASAMTETVTSMNALVRQWNRAGRI